MKTATLTDSPARPEPRTSTTSFLVLLAGGVAIGFAPIFVRLSEVGPVATAFWRMALSLPVLWAALIWNRHHKNPSGSPLDESVHAGSLSSWWPMALAGFLFAADLAFWHWSLHFTSVANSTLLSNFAPVFVVLFGAVFLGYRVTRRFIGAMVIALVGTCLLVGRDFHLQPHALAGDGLALVTAAFYGSYQLAIKNLRSRHGTLVILVRSGLVATILLLPVAMLSGEKLWPHSKHGWLVLVGLALIVHAGGQGMIAYALAKLPAAVASGQPAGAAGDSGAGCCRDPARTGRGDPGGGCCAGVDRRVCGKARRTLRSRELPSLPSAVITLSFHHLHDSARFVQRFVDQFTDTPRLADDFGQRQVRFIQRRCCIVNAVGCLG